MIAQSSHPSTPAPNHITWSSDLTNPASLTSPPSGANPSNPGSPSLLCQKIRDVCLCFLSQSCAIPGLRSEGLRIWCVWRSGSHQILPDARRPQPDPLLAHDVGLQRPNPQPTLAHSIPCEVWWICQIAKKNRFSQISNDLPGNLRSCGKSNKWLYFSEKSGRRL